MHNANQGLIRLRQPNVVPLSASWRCYPGNLGLSAILEMPGSVYSWLMQ